MSRYFCTRCNADLDDQPGFDPDGRWFYCKCCGQLLINLKHDDRIKKRFNDVEWFCDRCGAHLDIQEGFSDWCETWNCRICGCENRIDISEIIEIE